MAGTITQAKVTQFSTGLSQAMTKIDANVVAQVWSEALPILGDNLKEAAVTDTQALHYAANLGNAIKAGLAALVGSATYTAAQVQAAVNGALASAGFEGVGVTADFSTAGDLKLAFDTQDSGHAVTAAVDENLGLGNLDIAVSGTATTTVAAKMTFSAGIDASGFYLSTGGDTSFTLTTDTRLPGLTAAAEIGGIGVEAVSPSTTAFTGEFDLALKDGNGDGKLRSAELAGDLLDATLTGTADVDLNLSTDLPADAIMPKLTTQMHVGWSFDGATVNPTDDNSDFGEVPVVQFNNGTINLGSFFDGMAGKVLSQIGEITSPLMPIINFLTTPIPLLSDLGSSKVTLLDFMGLTPEETAAIQGLADIAALAAEVVGFADAGGITINLGSSSVSGDIRSDLLEDLTTQLSAAATAFDAQNRDLGTFLDLASKIAGGGLDFAIFEDAGSIGDMLLGKNVDLFSYETEFGFDYKFNQFFPVLGPIGVTLGGLFGLSAMLDFGFDTQGIRDYVDGGMTDPEDLFNGFYVQATDDEGNPVTGFRLTAGITAGVVATIGIAEVGVEGDITANIDFGIDAGLDPTGTGKIRGNILAITDIADLFDPSGSISAGLRAYLEIGFSPFSIEFSFDSPRITLLDFDGDKSTPPLLASAAGSDLLLNIGDRAAQRLHGNVTDGAEKITIGLSFNPLTPDAPEGLLLTGFGTLEFHDFSARIRGNGGKSSDDIILDARVNVAAILTGGLGRDELVGGAKADQLSGDEGADVLNGNGGKDTLRGGIGQDRLIGGAAADTLDGGEGLDTVSYVTASAGMTIDLATMIFTGDGAGDVLIDVERYEGTNFADLISGSAKNDMLLSGMDGNDTIRGLDGDDLLIGGGGDDNLNGNAGNDLLIGVAGADTLIGGAGIDTLSYVTSAAPVIVSLLTQTGTGGDALGDVLGGFENLTGSSLPFGDLGDRYTVSGRPITAGTGDILIGSDEANIITGLGGADFMDGAAGNDVLWGDAKNASSSVDTANDFEADTLRGGLGNDTLWGQTGDDDMNGDEGRDSLDGAEGNDHLRTMDVGSIDILFGGSGVNRLSADYSDKTISINWELGKNNDITFADGDSQKNFQNLGELVTADLRDVIRLDGALDDGYDNIIRTNGGNDVVFTGRGQDLIQGGSGNDRLFGGDGTDTVDGGAGSDFVNGGTDSKVFAFGFFGEIIGLKPEGTGPDVLYGGAGNDTVSFQDLQYGIDYLGAGGGTFPLGVTIDLLNNTTGGAATGIIIGGFENIIGTNAGDDLKGTDGDNIFMPLRGGGLFSGATGGPDRIDGRGGIDTLIIDFSLADVANLQGVYTNGNSIYRNTIGNTATVDSYIYENIEQVRLTGASKDDTLYGYSSTPGDDVISGLAGNDRIGGEGGSDSLFGGSGNDLISAQGTFDFGYSGTAGGRDILEGGAGNDMIENIAFGFGPAPLGADALFKMDGGTGFDILSADFSNQTAAIVWDSKAPGNLSLARGAYARNFEELRLFITGSGNDALTQEGRVNNQFWLGAGDDTVNAGLGFDTLNGDAGNDLLILDYSMGEAAGMPGLQGGGSSNEFYRRATPESSRIDSTVYFGFDRMLITGTTQDDSFAGSLGDDTLFGGAGNDAINSQNGGNDSVDGGSGNDTLVGSGGAFAAGADDTLTGGTGNDSLRSLTGNDNLYGGAGNDVLIADYDFTLGYGQDVLEGGAGDDFVSDINFAFSFGYSKPGDQLRLDGGAGNDTLTADFADQTQAITFVSGLSNSVEFANGSYFRSFEVITNLFTGAGNDRLVQLDRLNNVLSVLGGDDTVNAGLGVDSVFGGVGNDLLIVDYSVGDDANAGGIFVDVTGAYARFDLISGAVIDRVYAPEFERLQLTGTSKADMLQGLSGDDVLLGGGGADTLRGISGRDALNGGGGVDTADYSGGVVAVSVTLNGAAAVTLFAAGLAEDTLRGIENLTGGFGADSLTGDAVSNALNGGGGNDMLDGGAGSDVLSGGTGDDTFVVDAAGDSVLDAIFGGFDTVLTKGSYTLDTGQEIEVLRALDAGSVTAIRLKGNEFAQSITGNAGANVIAGAAGADTLTGLGGADIFVFGSAAAGIDVIQDFASGRDAIEVAAAGFGGGLVAGRAAILAKTLDIAGFSASGTARFIYDTSGADAGLYFDANGGSGADAVLFARLTGLPALVAADIDVV